MWVELRHYTVKPKTVHTVPQGGGRGVGHRRVQSIFVQRTRAEWIQCFADKTVCCEPANTLKEALSTPAVRDRGMVWELGSKEGRAAT
jgi:crotonobetainyl-CoA:carnitine CoA-transferase CaiB-like acyl-CoA transferase